MNYDLNRSSLMDIFGERRRLAEQDPTLEFDDACVGGELLWAALAYMVTPGDALWPFVVGYEPDPDPIKNLVKAGALIAAEADRLKRRQRAGLTVESGVIFLAMEAEEILDVVDGARALRRELDEMSMGRTGMGDAT